MNKHISHWREGDKLELWEFGDKEPSIRKYAGNFKFKSILGVHTQNICDDELYYFIKIVNVSNGDVLEREFKITGKGM